MNDLPARNAASPGSGLAGPGWRALLPALPLLKLTLPLAFTCTQSPLASLGLLGLLGFATAMAVLHGRADLARQMLLPSVAAMLGLSLTLGTLLSGAWGFSIGLFSFFLGIALLISWEAHLTRAWGPPKASDFTLGMTAGQPIDAPGYEYLPPGTELPQQGWIKRAFGLIPRPASSQWLAGLEPSPSAAEDRREEARDAAEMVDADGRLLFIAPTGTHRLQAEPFPLEQEPRACHSLWLDGEPSGLVSEAGWPVVWSEDGEALVCRACPESRIGDYAYWLWQAGSGWRLLPDPWQSLAAEPVLDVGQPVTLSRERLWRTASLRAVTMENPDYGYSRIECAEPAEATAVRLCSSLSGGGRQATTVHLQPMLGRIEPCLTWLRDSADGAHGSFACRIGNWLLDGEWCLDHRVSDCGRFLVLIQFAEAPAVPHRLAVADILAKRLLWLDRALIGPRLQAFRGGVLQVTHVLGRLSSATPSTPLQRYDERVPDAGKAERFLSSRMTGRLYYERGRIAVDPCSVRLMPGWHLAAPGAVMHDDFVLPAPTGRDAAWVFGVQATEGSAPGGAGACLLTASGCALAEVAPAMAWSEDGRYLALSRLAPNESSEAVWALVLLDTRERTLRQTRHRFMAAHRLLDFGRDGLHLQWTDEVDGQRTVALEELLGEPLQMLIRSGEFWFTAEEVVGAARWRHVDASQLADWRVPS